MNDRQTIKSLSHSSGLVTYQNYWHKGENYSWPRDFSFILGKSPKYRIWNLGNKQHSNRNLPSRQYCQGVCFIIPQILNYWIHRSSKAPLLVIGKPENKELAPSYLSAYPYAVWLPLWHVHILYYTITAPPLSRFCDLHFHAAILLFKPFLYLKCPFCITHWNPNCLTPVLSEPEISFRNHVIKLPHLHIKKM